VEAAYVVFVHTDAEADIRDLAGFKHVTEYGSRTPISPHELGSCENFRFVTSPDLLPYVAAGADIGATGLSGTAKVDVYPFIMVGEDAYGQVALRGVDALDPTYIPTGQKDKSDPLGQRGYVGAKFYMECTMLNEGWMAVAEAGVTAL
jgi:N4-gp56 family major capsid protein